MASDDVFSMRCCSHFIIGFGTINVTSHPSCYASGKSFTQPPAENLVATDLPLDRPRLQHSGLVGFGCGHGESDRGMEWVSAWYKIVLSNYLAKLRLKTKQILYTDFMDKYGFYAGSIRVYL